MRQIILAFTLVIAAAGVQPVCFAKLDSKAEAREKIKALNQKVIEAGKANDLQAAIVAAEDALSVASLAFGDDDPETAKALNNVANLYLFSEHPKEALELYKKALEIDNKKSGKKSIEAADTSYNMAMAYGMLAKFDDARASMKRTIEIRREKLGATHPDTLKAEQMLNEI